MDLLLLVCGGLIGSLGLVQAHYGWNNLKLAVRNPDRTGWHIVARTCLAIGLMRFLSGAWIVTAFEDGYGHTSSLLIPLLAAGALLEVRKLHALRRMGSLTLRCTPDPSQDLQD